MSGTSERRPRRFDMADVVRSVLVLTAIVLGLFFIGQWLFANDPKKPTPDVDWRTTATGVPVYAGFQPMLPAELPDGWYANSARFDEESWHLGITDGKDYIGVEQSQVSAETLTTTYAADTKNDGEVEIAGQTWEKRTGGGDTVFVRSLDDGTALLVTGTAPESDVQDFAASLEALPVQSSSAS